jgi:hypothetical protein
MTEPARDLDQRRAAPLHGVRQTHAVRGRAEAYVLLHTPAVPLTRRDRETAEMDSLCPCTNCTQNAASLFGLHRLDPLLRRRRSWDANQHLSACYGAATQSV